MASAPFILNIVMGLSNLIGAKVMTTPGKRSLLALFSLIGVVSTNALTGNPIQLDSLSNITQILMESFAAFIAAHGSYHLFWKD